MKALFLIFLLIPDFLAAQDTTNKSTRGGILHCVVTDMKGKKKAGETLIFEGVTRMASFSVITNSAGKADVILPKGNIYKIKIMGVGEEKDYSTVEIPSGEGQYEGTLTIKFELPLVVTLDNVLFETASSQLVSTSFKSLDQLTLLMKRKSEMTIEITGHTDNKGDPEKNRSLSMQRAAALRSYMVKRGIAEARIKIAGKGAEMPVADNGSEEGRRKNRRTEVRIINE